MTVRTIAGFPDERLWPPPSDVHLRTPSADCSHSPDRDKNDAEETDGAPEKTPPRHKSTAKNTDCLRAKIDPGGGGGDRAAGGEAGHGKTLPVHNKDLLPRPAIAMIEYLHVSHVGAGTASSSSRLPVVIWRHQ